MFWELDVKDILTEFIRDPFSQLSVDKLLDSLDYSYEVLFAPTSATRLVSVYGKNDYAFSINELAWLRPAEEVLCYRLTGVDDFSLFFVNLCSDESDYYLSAAALIKIFNIAFPGRSVFVFRVDDAVVFGSTRDYQEQTENNFAVSGMISESSNDECFEFLDVLLMAEIDEIPLVIRHYSPHEDTNLKDYDGISSNHEYLLSLEEIEHWYGVDTSRERERAFYTDSEKKSILSYRDACLELRGIAETGGKTSYQELDAAEEAELKANNASMSVRSPIIENEYEEPLHRFSAAAYDNAEQMLKELMEKDNDNRRGEGI